MKRITFRDIDTLRFPTQHYCDCYLVSSLAALTRCKNGRSMLSRNINQNSDSFKVKFRDVDGKNNAFIVSKDSCKKLYDGFIKQEPSFANTYNPFLKAVELAMESLLFLNPDKKSIFSRLEPCERIFEYNRPSNFMEMFTGKKPIVINEGSIRMSLKKHKDKVLELFQRMDKEKDFSFIVGNGFKSFNKTIWHCFTVQSVDMQNRKISIVENRSREIFTLPFDKVIKKFKFFVGYFNDMLK